MKKRFMLLHLVVAAACAILWAVMSDSKPEHDQPAVGASDEVQTKQTVDAEIPEEVKTEATTARQSPRHAAGELEKSRRDSLAALNKAVSEQEARVEEKRMVLATIVRTKGIIYREGGSVDVAAAENNANAAQEYVEAKREFEADQELLQEMKLKLLGETMKARQSGK